MPCIKKTASDRIKTWLMRRDYSHKELITRIRQTGLAIDNINSLILELENEGYLNVERFACSRARVRASQGYGPNRLMAELKQHDIDINIIQIAIDSVDWSSSWQRRVKKTTKHDLRNIAWRYGFPIEYMESESEG